MSIFFGIKYRSFRNIGSGIRKKFHVFFRNMFFSEYKIAFFSEYRLCSFWNIFFSEYRLRSFRNIFFQNTDCVLFGIFVPRIRNYRAVHCFRNISLIIIGSSLDTPRYPLFGGETWGNSFSLDDLRYFRSLPMTWISRSARSHPKIRHGGVTVSDMAIE